MISVVAVCSKLQRAGAVKVELATVRKAACNRETSEGGCD